MHLSVTIFIFDLGIKGLNPGRENYRSDIDFCFLDSLSEIYGVSLTDAATDITLILFQVKTAFINIRNQGNGLGEIYMNRFIV